MDAASIQSWFLYESRTGFYSNQISRERFYSNPGQDYILSQNWILFKSRANSYFNSELDSVRNQCWIQFMLKIFMLQSKSHFLLNPEMDFVLIQTGILCKLKDRFFPFPQLNSVRIRSCLNPEELTILVKRWISFKLRAGICSNSWLSNFVQEQLLVPSFLHCWKLNHVL